MGANYTFGMLRIELMSWEQARERAAPLRLAVFVDEQGVPREIELDEHDAHCVHALALTPEGEAIGTGRLLPAEPHDGRPVGHIGRMAVRRDWRGCGAGAAILEQLVDAARARGDACIELSAQTHALGFYAAHDFVAYGEVYLEAGIEHQAMRREF
jgi:predicted GNAT family N-acyltransferase